MKVVVEKKKYTNAEATDIRRTKSNNVIKGKLFNRYAKSIICDYIISMN